MDVEKLNPLLHACNQGNLGAVQQHLSACIEEKVPPEKIFAAIRNIGVHSQNNVSQILNTFKELLDPQGTLRTLYTGMLSEKEWELTALESWRLGDASRLKTMLSPEMDVLESRARTLKTVLSRLSNQSAQEGAQRICYNILTGGMSSMQNRLQETTPALSELKIRIQQSVVNGWSEELIEALPRIEKAALEKLSVASNKQKLFLLEYVIVHGFYDPLANPMAITPESFSALLNKLLPTADEHTTEKAQHLCVLCLRQDPPQKEVMQALRDHCSSVKIILPTEEALLRRSASMESTKKVLAAVDLHVLEGLFKKGETRLEAFKVELQRLFGVLLGEGADEKTEDDARAILVAALEHSGLIEHACSVGIYHLPQNSGGVNGDLFRHLRSLMGSAADRAIEGMAADEMHQSILSLFQDEKTFDTTGSTQGLETLQTDIIRVVQSLDHSSLVVYITKLNNRAQSALAAILHSVHIPHSNVAMPGLGEKLLAYAIRSPATRAEAIIETLLRHLVHLAPAFPTGDHTDNDPDPLVLAAQIGNRTAVRLLVPCYEQQNTPAVNARIEQAILQTGRNGGDSAGDIQQYILLLEQLSANENIAKRFIPSDEKKTFKQLIAEQIDSHRKRLSTASAITAATKEGTIGGLFENGATTTQTIFFNSIRNCTPDFLLKITLPMQMGEYVRNVPLLTYAATKGLYSIVNTGGVSPIALNVLLNYSGVHATQVIQDENLIGVTNDLGLKNVLAAHCLKYPLYTKPEHSNVTLTDLTPSSPIVVLTHERGFKRNHPHVHAGLHAFGRVGFVVGFASFLAVAVMSTFEAWNFHGSHDKMHDTMKSLCKLLCWGGREANEELGLERTSDHLFGKENALGYEHGHKESFLALSSAALALTSAIIGGVGGAVVSACKKNPSSRS